MSNLTTHRRAGALLALLMSVGALLIVGVSPSAAAQTPPPTPVPTLTPPPEGTRGHALWDSYYDLAPFGYEDQELFVSGTAVDQRANPAAYTTRIIVTRPIDPARFNGTVLLDWVNVSAQFENAVDTMLTREMLMREGFAYVHVSVQAAGLCCFPGLTPQTWDPVRYGALHHPGDAWAFDIFSQVARAFRGPADPDSGSVDPMGALGVARVRHVLAAGQSQSGIRLHDYLNSWLPAHPAAAGLIDGFLVHGNVFQTKTYLQALPVPVLNLLSDFEALDDGVDPAQLDPNLRLWEVAGTSHADLFIGYQSMFGHGPRVSNGAERLSRTEYQSVIDAAGNYGEQVTPVEGVCVAAGATMPMHYAASAAIHQLNTWVGGGSAPAHGPRFTFANGLLATDEYGNTRGGIRLPPIDVPVAQYQSALCGLGGVTIPFPDAQIQSLYPTHGDYLALMARHADAAVQAGWLLVDDAVDLMRRACAASNRWPTGQAPCPSYTPPAVGRAASPAAPGVPPTAAAPSSGRGSQTIPATGGAVPTTVALGLLAGAVALAQLVRAGRS